MMFAILLKYVFLPILILLISWWAYPHVKIILEKIFKSQKPVIIKAVKLAEENKETKITKSKSKKKIK